MTGKVSAYQIREKKWYQIFLGINFEMEGLQVERPNVYKNFFCMYPFLGNRLSFVCWTGIGQSKVCAYFVQYKVR